MTTIDFVNRNKTLIYECIRQNTGFNETTKQSDIMPVYQTRLASSKAIRSMKRNKNYTFLTVINFSLPINDNRVYHTVYCFYNSIQRRLEFIIVNPKVLQ